MVTAKLALTLCLLLPAVAVSAVYDEGAAVPPPAVASPAYKGLEVIAGPSILKGQVGAALALRYPLIKDISLEIGGTMPHKVTGYGSKSAVSPALTSTTRISSFAESHLVLLYPLYRYQRFTLDAGAGLSVAVMNDYVSGAYSTGSPFIQEDHKIIPSPLIQLGAAVHLISRLSVRLDIGWVRYPNHKTYPQDADLTFNAIVIRPGVVWVF